MNNPDDFAKNTRQGSAILSDGGNVEPSNILIVDDQSEQTDLGCTVLTRCGFKVFTANTFHEAVLQSRANPIDLAVIDLFLDDGLLGRQLLVELRDIRPNLLVLFTSGLNEGNELDQALAHTRTAFIKKPYRIAEFADAVKNTLQRFRM